MSDRLALTLESAFIVLTLGGKSFRLDAPKAEWRIEPDTNENRPREIKRYVKWKYHAAYHEAFDLGSVNSAKLVIEEVAALLPPPPSAADDLIARWDDIVTQVKSVPIINHVAGSAIDTAMNTSVKITDLALDLKLKSPAPAAGADRKWSGDGAFTLGLAFTPSDSAPIRLFRLGIQAFGAVVSVNLQGVKLEDGQLKWGS